MRRGLLLLGLIGAACAAPQPRATALPPLPPPEHPAHDEMLAATPPKEELRLTPIDRATYDRAQELARGGSVREGKRLLAKLLVAYPDQRALVDEYNALQAIITAGEGAAKTALEAHSPIVLAPPPVTATKAHDARVDAGPVAKLTLRTKKKNDIVGDEGWFRANHITRPEYFIPPANDLFFVDVDVRIDNVRATFSGFGFYDAERPAHFRDGDLPLWVPVGYGTLPITEAIDSAPYTIAIYGGRVLAVFDDAKKLRAHFDFGAYVHPPANQQSKVKVGEATLTTPTTTRQVEVSVEQSSITHELRWALAKGNTVFVEHMNRSFAKDNKGQNAYITAVDLDSGSLAWRSGPLVANAETFVLAGGGVVSGYGFSSEPDFVYVLDATTGKQSQKIAVPSGPSDIVSSGASVFVRTYDTDLVFDAK